MTEIFDKEGIASLRRRRPVRIYETPQEYYEGPAGANIGQPMLSLQREGLSLPMHTFLGENLTGTPNQRGFLGLYTPTTDTSLAYIRGLVNIERAKSRDRVGRRFGNRQLPLYMPGRQQDKPFMREQEKRGVDPFSVAGWLEQQSKNIPKGQRRPPERGAAAILLSPQNFPDVSYEHLSPEQMVKIQKRRNLELRETAKHEAGHHGLADTVHGEESEPLNRYMDYITSTDPEWRRNARTYLGKTEPEMIQDLDKKSNVRRFLNILLRKSNERLAKQGRPTIANQEVIERALAQRRRELPRPVYPKVKNTGGMIERNPYPYEARAI
jgi:hypothetical protein